MIFTPELNALIDNTPDLLLCNDLYRMVHDPKFPGKESVLYVPDDNYDQAVENGSVHTRIERFVNDEAFEHQAQTDFPQGLLYLPYPYLVPGGRFKEMYGWDTAFPVFAWSGSRPRLMREQIDNHLYQIRAYGKVLNANRIYYLGRSHPPTISMMVMAFLESIEDKPWAASDPYGVYRNQEDWLRRAYRDLCSYHDYWTSGNRLAGETGLSRYWDDLDLPAAEVLSSEVGHFDHAIHHFGENPDDHVTFFQESALTQAYYRADRAMRASGFDPTAHWGYGGLRCMFHAPVCLNSLLYKMEMDLQVMAAVLGLENDVPVWKAAADIRKQRMWTYLWDDATGTFQDYDFALEERNPKPFATSLYPLYAGIFDPATDGEKIASTVSYSLEKLEQPYGLCVSTEASGSQWDYPQGWPPLHYFAVTGLSRYGFMKEAERLAEKFCALVQSVYTQDQAIYEKYNVVHGNAEIVVVHGYSTNVSENGTFLWTAAVARLLANFLETQRKSADENT
jgi:alpha,alpha-trehalase